MLLVFVSFIFSSSAQARRRKKKAKAPLQSHNFFAFDDATYHTSPDKRIGAKLLIDTDKVGPTIAAMVHLTYLPGAHVKSHRHVFVTEIIHVLSGNLTVRIGDETKVLGPNATAYIPPKTFCEYLNDSTDVVKFLQYFSPPGPEEEYRNWEVPNEAKTVLKDKAKGNDKQEEPVETNIVVPTARPVPGSPQPLLGSVHEVDSEPVDEKKEVKDLPVKTTPDENVDLKLKLDK